MDAYPLDLILAVATASATIFLGFLPTKNISSDFFARETGKTLVAWVLVALLSPAKILHFPLIFALFCSAAWWEFRRNHALNGKMWLWLASGLGISTGVLLILAVTPFAYPPYLPPLNAAVLLASVYLGGTVIGLAYFCFALVQGAKNNSVVKQGIIQHYVGLLLVLTLARAAILLVEILPPASPYNDRVIGLIGRLSDGTTTGFTTSTHQLGPILLVPILLLVILAFFAKRATGFSSRIQPTRFLIAIILIDFLIEILARLLVL